MKFERNEIYTGLLVLVTVAILIGVILLLAVPGIFKPLHSYQIFFDNAAGLKPGAPVLVAGHQIGQVALIEAPVAKARRPAKYPEDEVLITVRIDSRAIVYRNATPRMIQNGLLGEPVIDFVGGTEESGDAQTGYVFVGERVPDLNTALPKVLAVIEPVASAATLTLSELRRTVDTLNAVFGQEGDLRAALTKLRTTADNISGLTAPDGSLGHTFTNLQDFTTRLKADDGPLMATLNNLQKTTGELNKDDRVEKMLANFEQASARADAAAKQANALLAGLTPSFNQSAANLAQMTDTLKKQPWRIIWPTTKKYEIVPGEGNAAAAPAAPHPAKALSRGPHRARGAAVAATPGEIRTGPLLTD